MFSLSGFGDITDPGNYVVYNGGATGVTVTGLTSSTTYDFAIYTFNSVDNCNNMAEATATATTLNVSSPYRIDLVDGLIISTCSGTFTDAGGAGSYSNNEDYTVTFCSASGLPLKFDFSSSGSFDIDVPNDTLFFYDGFSASGTPFAILTDLDDHSQTDFDGSISVSQVVSAVPEEEGNDALMVSSNENNGLTVYFNSDDDMKFDLILYDMAGRLIYLAKVEAIDGSKMC